MKAICCIRENYVLIYILWYYFYCTCLLAFSISSAYIFSDNDLINSSGIPIISLAKINYLYSTDCSHCGRLIKIYDIFKKRDD